LDAWLWLGDAVYAPKHKQKGLTSPETLQEELNELKQNATIGYRDFLARNSGKMVVAGVYDDHDFGGNDMGRRMPLKNERRDVLGDFLGYDNKWSHEGMYHRMDLEPGVKMLMLDTRWFRDDHCIPSVAHWVPMGNAIACMTRWLTSGLFLHRVAWLWGRGQCENGTILGLEQWNWLQQQLLEEDDSALIIVASSIQIWSTNPAMEGWGQFPKEQERLSNLLRLHYEKSTSPVIFLSGDVHHAEISGQPGYLEITSSGLTHHCGQPKLYGRLCRPLLENFHGHRHSKQDYYIGLNYGIIEIDWIQRRANIQIHNYGGETVLQVDQPLDFRPDGSSFPSSQKCPQTWDGHLLPYASRIFWTLLAAILVVSTRLWW